MSPANPVRLPLERVTDLGAGEDARERALERGALDDLVGELGRQPVGDGLLEHPLEGGVLEGAADGLLDLLHVDRQAPRSWRLGAPRLQRRGDDPLDHVVLDDRAPDRLGERPGHDAVERLFGLVVERVLPGVRDRAHGAQRCGPGRPSIPVRLRRPRRRSSGRWAQSRRPRGDRRRSTAGPASCRWGDADAVDRVTIAAVLAWTGGRRERRRERVHTSRSGPPKSPDAKAGSSRRRSIAVWALVVLSLGRPARLDPDRVGAPAGARQQLVAPRERAAHPGPADPGHALRLSHQHDLRQRRRHRGAPAAAPRPSSTAWRPGSPARSGRDDERGQHAAPAAEVSAALRERELGCAGEARERPEGQDGQGITTGNGTVTLDLRELLIRVAQKLGLPGTRLQQLPPGPARSSS